MTNQTVIYDENTPLGEPIEVRTEDRMGNRYTMIAWITEHGTIGWNYTNASGSTPHALSNVGSHLPFPRKAVPGWQRDVFNFVANGYGKITEVR
jgi:hypothetical protein